MRKGPSLYVRMKLRYIKLILRGVKLYEENKNNKKRYNYYNFIFGLVLACYASSYIRHNFMQSEYDIRQQPNILIPKGVYDVRKKHYIYWELSRVARGKQKIFSYQYYDRESKLLNFVDRKGVHFVEKIIFDEERPDIMINPLLENLIKNKPWNDQQLERANLLTAYYLNLNRRYDLDNYLHYKSINPMDFVRWIYYTVMTKSKFADTYRYEQYLPKPDLLYDIEALFIAANMNSKDKQRVIEDVGFIFLFFFACLIPIIPNHLNMKL